MPNLFWQPSCNASVPQMSGREYFQSHIANIMPLAEVRGSEVDHTLLASKALANELNPPDCLSFIPRCFSLLATLIPKLTVRRLLLFVLKAPCPLDWAKGIRHSDWFPTHQWTGGKAPRSAAVDRPSEGLERAPPSFDMLRLSIHCFSVGVSWC